MATLLAAMLLTSAAQAVLTNRYSFTTDATDTVGGKNGTLIGTNGSFANGQLVLANTGEGSQTPGATGAYLNLPNGLITGAAATSGAVTVEMWVTMQANRDWAAAFTAGTSINGEDTSDCCNDDQPYIQVIPRTGDGGQGNDLRVTTNSYGGPEGFVDDNGAGDGTDLAIGRKEHVVAVFDQSGGLPGNVTVYRNGNLMGTTPIAANLNLKTFLRQDNTTGGDVNIWVGKSQWPDSLVAASFDELRIYSHALSGQEALADTVFGPDVTGATAIPSIVVNKTTGAVTVKNNANAPVKLEYYTIASAAGALKTATWNSLDAQNYNAVDGTDAGSVAGDSVGEGWDAAGGSNANQLTELFLGAAGSTLAPNASLNLGNAYNTSIFGGSNGDLVFKFGVLNGAALITAPVTYVTTGVPGDYNGNGIVDAADYTVWRDSLGKTGTGLAADGDGNNAVDQADYTYWKTRFGNTSGSGAGQAGSVPEPTSLVLTLLALVLLAAKRTK